MAWHDVTGTVADWVMAGAALYAAWNAKGWFSQRSHSKGLDKAEEILYHIDEYTLNTIKTVSDIHSNFSLFEEIKQSRSVPYEKEHPENNENLLWHNDYKNNVINLIEDLYRLERWAIKITNSGDMLKVTNELINMHTSAAHFYACCDGCLYQLHNMGWNEFENQFKVLKTNYDDYLLALHNLERAYDKFKTQRFEHFFKLQ